MPARDLFHEAAKSALVKDGWTHDPLKLTVVIGFDPKTETIVQWIPQSSIERP